MVNWSGQEWIQKAEPRLFATEMGKKPPSTLNGIAIGIMAMRQRSMPAKGAQ